MNTSAPAPIILWRWQEHLAPKITLYLLRDIPREEAEKLAAAAGEYIVTRTYQVSIDDGATWYSAPPDMPVLDIDGNPMPEERRRTGKPSDAAVREKDRRLLDAAARNQSKPRPGAN